MTLDEFFAGHGESREIFDTLLESVAAIGPVQVRVTKSQVSLRRSSAFAFARMPKVYPGDRGAPPVLTVGLRRRDDSPRWKQIVEPTPGRFTHHLELRSVDDIGDEVRRWVREAWEAAG